jgi:hypothetical protein
VVVDGLLALLGTEADEALLVEVWYPKSSTTMVMVDASQMTIRLIDSPSEAFAVDTAAGYACCQCKPCHTFGPRAGAAEEDVTICKIGNPPSQGDQLGDPTGGRTEDRRWRTPRAGKVDDLQALCPSELIQLASKQRFGGVALQNDRLTWGVLESLRECT